MDQTEKGSRPCDNSDGSNRMNQQNQFYPEAGQQSRPQSDAAASASQGDLGSCLESLASTLFEPTDIVEIRCIARGAQIAPSQSFWPHASELHAFGDQLNAFNMAGYDLFFGVNPRKCVGGSTNADVLLCRCLFADLDNIGAEAGLEEIQAAGLPQPSLATMSGTGLHPFYRLTEPIHDLEVWRALQKRLIAALPHADNVHDPARVMRLPGSINHKHGIRAQIVNCHPGVRFNVEDMMKALPNAKAAQGTQPVAAFNATPHICPAADPVTYVQNYTPTGAGNRNNAAYQLAAVLTHDFQLSLDQAWPLMQAWNTRNGPPLEPEELLACLKNGSSYGKNAFGQKSQKNCGQGIQLIRLCEQELADAFLDQFGRPYVGIPCGEANGRVEIVAVDSTRFRNLLALRGYQVHGKPPSSQALNQAKVHIEAVCGTKPRRVLSRRVVSCPDGTMWYDLGTDNWQGVHLTAAGWGIGPLPPLFRRSTHQLPQVVPISGGDPRLLLRFCNVQPDDQCLFMAVVASFFIPGFPHPPLIEVGPPGSGKTRLMSTVKRLVDPSIVTCLAPPKNDAIAEHQFTHHYVVAWDNVGSISHSLSDALCRCCTGGGGSQRSLFTNDEDFVRTYQGCTILNSVGNVCYQPDLVDRVVIIETAPLQEPIDERRYQALWDQQAPLILGGFFDAVCRALGMNMEWPGRLSHG